MSPSAPRLRLTLRFPVMAHPLARDPGHVVVYDSRMAKARATTARRKAAGSPVPRVPGGSLKKRAVAARPKARIKAKKPRRAESLEVRKERAVAVLRVLRGLYPEARCELMHRSV